MKNKYEIRGETTVIFIQRNDGSILETIIDTNDFEKANSFHGKWWAMWSEKTKSFYVAGNICSGTRRKGTFSKKTILLHRIIMNTAKYLVVDHINHDTLDNRKENLRNITQNQNKQNVRRTRKTKSGVRGVYLNSEVNMWVVYTNKNGKTKYVGIYRELEEAKKVSLEVRKKTLPFATVDVANV